MEGRSSGGQAGGFGCFTVHGPPLIDWMVDGMCVGFVAMRTDDDDDDDDHGLGVMRGVGPFRPSVRLLGGWALGLRLGARFTIRMV